MPKIELHRHLNGSLRLQTLAELAREYKLDVPSYEPETLRPYVQVMPDSPATVAHFLSKFNVLRKFYCSPDIIKRIAREAVEDAAADNVKYMEFRVTPKAYTRQKNYDIADVLEWICDTVAETQKSLDIIVKVVVAPNRHESTVEGRRAIRLAIDRQRKGVIVGVDLCGQEEGYPANPFAGIINEAREAGLGVTVHAGEWAGPYNVRYAIEKLGATRIGHGVRILEDPAIIRLAQEQGVVFEVCPTSNLHSGVIRSAEQHPLLDMRYLGLRTTINTDDPGVSNITLTDELYRATQQIGLTLDDIKQATLTAARAAFLPEAERAQLISRFERELAMEQQ